MSVSFSRPQIRKRTDGNALFGITNGTAAANKALVLDANKAIGTITTLTATTANATTLTAGTISAGAISPDVKVSTADPAPATTGLVDITGLTGQALVAGATYRFRCVLPGLADGTSGITYAFKYTTATLTSIEATGITYTASAVAAVHTTTTTDATLLVDKAAAVILSVIEGTMVVNAAGTVKLQAGLHTGTTAAAVYVGSTMQFTRIA